MSVGELFVIALVTVVLFGPKKLPLLVHHVSICMAKLHQLKKKAASFWEAQLNEYQLQQNIDKAKQAEELHDNSLG